MAERLKDMFFTLDSINKFADAIEQHYPSFDKPRFLRLMFDESFEAKELLDKMRHTTKCLFDTLPKPYKKALDILMKAAPDVKGFEAMALPDIVATYGMDYWDLSLPALRHFTKHYSSELAWPTCWLGPWIKIQRSGAWPARDAVRGSLGPWRYPNSKKTRASFCPSWKN